MTRAYNVVDADGHILEPLDLWDKYIDPEFRERRPRFVIDDNGKERLSVEGKLLGNPRGIGSLGSVGVRQGIVKPDTLKYAEGRKGGFDPHARIVDMDADGIDAAFLYPSLGLFAGAVEDPGLAAAMCRAYNRWLADYCKPYPERLFGVAMLPMQSVDLAVDEMRYAREKLGMRGGFLRPNPYHGKKMISDPMYEPFWKMAEDLDFSIGFHEGSTTAMPTVGVDRFEDDRAARHMISHTMEMMLVALSVIWGGVVDRHPRLRVAFLESGGGWIAPWLDRMDRHFDDQGFNESAPKMRPSELFQRNCWISFEPVESSIAVLADYIGPHKIMWATDYPHSDGFFPGAPQMLRERLGPLSAEAKHQVLAGGALSPYLAARRSHRGVAAVDEQQRAGHVGGVVRGEKQDAGGDFIGRAVTPEQRALGGVIPVLVERATDRLIALLVKGRVDRPGADRVHPDAVRGVIRRHPACQPGDRRLRGVVLRRLADARHGSHRGDVDDAAGRGLPEERNRRLRAERVPLEIHAEDLVPALGAGLFHRVIQPDAGVVDEDVEPSEALRGLPNEVRGLHLTLHVRFHEYDLAAARRDLRRDPLAPLDIAVCERHLRPFRHEPPHGGLADPRGSTGHRRYLPVQSCHARCPPSAGTIRQASGQIQG